MAKYTKVLTGELNQIKEKIKSGIMQGSISASLEDSYDYNDGVVRCSVLVFERYSYSGGNRVSMNVTLIQRNDGNVQLCAITSGGSQATFFKLNTWGEEAFLQKLKEIV